MRATVFAAAAIVVVAGCNGGGDSASGGQKKPTVAADVPKGFDPCKDIPKSLMDSQGFIATSRKDTDGGGGIMWRGCGWVNDSEYTVSITTTNITLDMVRAKGFRDPQEFMIGGRHAMTTHQFKDDGACIADAEMKGGSLEILLDVPPSASAAGDACQLAHSLLEKISPLMPATA
ncbi:DUF3558 domain-containing protein [Nocardia panacis]|uniref:DUF3558 domain-containing protein n=1 Tax=Nocardia panacis TaxID=2340916 RepID=UPI001EEFA116|nr:DUF3558 domain-containing protein [Nocardia panacis]